MKLTKIFLYPLFLITFLTCLSANAQKRFYYNPDDGNIFMCVDISQVQFVTAPVKPRLTGIQICDQVWMEKNLAVARYRNGDPIPRVTDAAKWNKLTTGAYCYYNNDSARYAAVYGKLYNWYAVNDPRGLAPLGWHIPTIEEWTALETCLTTKTDVGSALKQTGFFNWVKPNTGATNSSNFNAVPGGFRDFDGTFYFTGKFGYWWSASAYYDRYAWARTLNYFDSKFGRDGYKKQDAFSVRCLRD